MGNYTKHQFGYISVDEDYLYFTTSDNAKEKEALGEFVPKQQRKTWIYGSIVFAISMISFLIAFAITSPSSFIGVGISVAAAMGLNIYAVLSMRYVPKSGRIPRENVLSIEHLNSYELVIKMNTKDGELVEQYLWLPKYEVGELTKALLG